MDHHELSASLFADKIGVQRSSISHILSGRNKPSLDFILKITTEFEDVDLQWLINGVGFFPKKATQMVLISGNDIVWVLGQRIDDRYAVKDSTKKVYFAELKHSN